MLQCNRFDEGLVNQPQAWITGNRVTFSSLNHCRIEDYTAATYSIKYVQQGTEHYFLHKRKFSVSAGHFLLVNGNRPIDFFIRSRKKVTGFCIHLEESLLQEVYAHLRFGGERLLDDPFERVVVPPLEELLYKDAENRLGAYLRQMAGCFDRGTATIPVEPAALYYTISEHLLRMQNSFLGAAGGLGVTKNSTKQELLRRLAVAKELLDEQEKNDELKMDAVAQQCALSGSHLFRSFKKFYGVSPYQYLLQQKINKATRLLQTKEVGITEVALQCGFADGAGFSKAFKKIKGLSPTAFVQAGR